MPSTVRAPGGAWSPAGMLLALALAIAACGGRAAETPPAPAAVPLANLAGQRVLLLPTPHINLSVDSGPALSLPRESTLAALDSTIERALADRARTVSWVTVAEVARTSRRNATMAPDPYALSSESLRRPAVRAQSSLAEPLASQLRSLTALNDARLLLYPLDLRLQRGSGTSRATLRVALIDARLSQVLWIGDVAGQSADSSLSALFESVAGSLADLFAAE